MKRLVPILSTAACLGVIAFFAGTRSNAAPARPAAQSGAKTSQLTILATSDVLGKTSPCGCRVPRGGLSRRAFFRDSMAKVHSQMSIVDNGGFSPQDKAREDEAWFMMEMMAKLGMDAVGTGPNDLQFGYAELKTNLARTGLPMTSANLIDKTTLAPALPPFVIAKVGDVKVGYFSLMPMKTDLGTARDSLQLADPEVAATKAVAELRKQGATVVVLLSQLGSVESEDLVSMVPGIDAVVCGGRNSPLLAKGRMFDNTVASYPGSEGHYVGVTTLKLGAGGKAIARESVTVPLGPEVADRPDVLEQVRAFEAALKERLAKNNPQDAHDHSHATSGGGHNH
jgi:2',3'-cyclic-nucleotide 2'-phosphodiesterase (5'-nucleotidase family)